MGCCGLRKFIRKPQSKPEEPKEEETESKVTCCGMKKSPSSEDELLEEPEPEVLPEAQKLEPIEEESATGSVNIKSDADSESQQVQKAETK